jgi:hypothetical protein
MVRTLELYWSGLATWMVQRIHRHWRREEVDAALEAATLRVGTELVAARHGEDAGARLALEQLAFVLAVAERAHRVTTADADRVRRAIRVVEELLP